MKKIETLEELAPMITAQWKRGVITNAPFSAESYRREIQAGTLYAREFPGGLLLVRRRESFDRLYFYIQKDGNPLDWKPERVSVTEIAVRAKDMALKASEEMWQELGFQKLLSRLRMTMENPEATVGSYPVREATPSDLAQIYRLLYDHYDPRTGCLPTEEELRRDIDGGNILMVDSEDRGPVGLLHTVLSGRVSECRHLVVLPEFRRRGIAESLLAFDYKRCRTKKFMLWVAAENEPARKLYGKLGYAPDGWTSTVWIYNKEGNDLS